MFNSPPCCSFCSEKHRLLHVDGDGSCLPYQVVSEEGAGRGRSVRATRDINPGELIFRSVI